ncbi:hypothetical protein ACGFIV_05305 [Sphaerisporangium sp. NPDC049003]|uniref:hypothetical protein n=1 Tax=Sphaerisporangium sp. NPDC049003 TaxID=3364517 RepID=UPI0037135A3D
MSGRVARWVGGALVAVAVIGLGVYFTTVGLDKADKLASVIGVFIGLAGLALAIYGLLADRRTGPPSPRPSTAQDTGSVRNEIHGGTHYGPVIQGRDFRQVNLGSSPPPAPDGPDTSTEG